MQCKFVNRANESMCVTAESFFQGRNAWWKTEYFAKPVLKVSSECSKKLVDDVKEGADNVGKGSSSDILKGAAEKRKGNLVAARSKRNPPTKAMGTPDKQTAKAHRADKAAG